MNNCRIGAHDQAKIASSIVFELDNSHKAILAYIARNGPSTITEISEFTIELPSWKTNRFAINRRLDGSGKNLRLIPKEYLIKQKQERQKHGKKGHDYYLSVKGLLASISANVPLEDNYLFTRYVRYVRKTLDREWTRGSTSNTIFSKKEQNLINKDVFADICENFIKYRILTFVLWHAVNGIHLTNLIASQAYFYDFYSNVNESFNSKFPTIKDPEMREYARDVLWGNYVYSRVIHALDFTSKQQFRTHSRSVLMDVIYHKLRFVADLLWYWFYHMEKMQFLTDRNSEYPASAMPNFIYEPMMGIDVEAKGKTGEKIIDKPRVFHSAKKLLVDLGIPDDDVHGLLLEIVDKSHLSFSVLNQRKIF